MNDDKPGVAERYCSATHSTDLTPRLKGVTDADVLLAAGIAASGDSALRLALTVYRMAVTGERSGMTETIAQLEDWLFDYMRANRMRTVPRHTRKMVVTAALRWWFNPTCGHCAGRGWLVAEGTHRLSGKHCEPCGGYGRRPLHMEVPHAHRELAQWIVGRLDFMVGKIHDRMAHLLSQRMPL